MVPNANPRVGRETTTGQPNKRVASPLTIIVRLADIVAVVALLGIVLGVFILVVARNVFNVGVVWVDDAVRYLQIWMVFGAAVGLTLRGEHITMEALYDAVPAAVQRVLRLFYGLASIGAAGLLAWIGWQGLASAWRIGQRSWSGSLPAVVGLSAPVVGFALITLASVVYLWTQIRAKND